jgi:hypothetical protein
MTKEEQARLKAEMEQKRREEQERAAANKARQHTLGGALDIFKRKDTPIKKDKDKEVENYASGGFVRAADGCATRGKTRGRMV